MNLNAVAELESWLQFPIDYADGVALLADLTTSPSYSDYVKRVAEASLKSSEDIASAVGVYLVTHPRRVEIAEDPPLADTKPVASPSPSLLRTRCIYCNHNGLYQRKISRMTSRGWTVFVVFMILFFPLAIIPLIFMREGHYGDFCNRCGRMQDID